MDGHDVLERPAGSRHPTTALRQIRELAETLDLKLVLFCSSLRTGWGPWFVATPERLDRLEAELSELVRLTRDIELASGVPPEDLET